MRMLRVLSIDWDYFINASMEERMMLFPDGGNENLPMAILDSIWMTRYENPKLSAIQADSKACSKIVKLFNNTIKKSTYVSVADSHSVIYDLISNHLGSKNFTGVEYDGIQLYNVDFHHDYYGSNPILDVDCGNWVHALFDEGNPFEWEQLKQREYYWVSRSDSDNSGQLEQQPWFHHMDLKTLCKQRETWDIVFLCRSSAWSCPHLDKQFYELIKSTQAFSSSKLMSFKKSLPNRYTNEFKQSVETCRKQIEEMKYAFTQEEVKNDKGCEQS